MEKIAMLLLSIMLVSPCFSEDDVASDEAQAPGSMWYMSIGQIGIDKEAAAQEGIKDTATYLRFAWERRTGELILGLGATAYFYRDRARFSQEVEDYFGDVSEQDSNATALSLFGEVGYGYRLSPYVSVDAIAGVEAVLSSERSISNCSDCYSQDIDINSGAYVMPRLIVRNDNGFTAGLSYQHYLGGDVDSSVAALFGWSY